MALTSGEFSNWMYNNKCYSVKGSLPFELGKTYKRRDGKDVKIIAVSTQRGYETVQGDDGASPTSGFRYNRDNDRGRCTGTAGDYSDPRNLLPEFEPGVKNAGEGFFVEVSLLSANKPDDVKKKFRELLILEDTVIQLKYRALDNNDWKSACEGMYNPDVVGQIQKYCKELGFFTNLPERTDDYKADARNFSWAFTDLIEEHRLYYA
jgi:hypothetical protein